ncbi:MAG: hypothetical protein COA69_13000 [Robiginitomaculum sp.]|nr:MAG: hypothetical protein COA69_13000 [Robiginitomaculum sp.]
MTNTLLKKIPSQKRSQKTLERIFQAAQTVLADQGFKAFTIRNIASQANIGAASIYDYFPNKQALLIGFCQERLQRKLEIFHTHLLGDNLSRPANETLPEYYQALRQSGLMSKLDLELRHARNQDPALKAAITEFENNLLECLCTFLRHHATHIPEGEMKAWAKYMLNLDYAAMQIKHGANEHEMQVYSKLQMETSLAILRLAGIDIAPPVLE